MRIKYILAILLQFVVLFGMIGMRQIWVARGTKIKFRAVAKHTREFLTGDYVILLYEISYLVLDELKCKESFKKIRKSMLPWRKMKKGIMKHSQFHLGSQVMKFLLLGEQSLNQRPIESGNTNFKTKTVMSIILNIGGFFPDLKKGDEAILCLDKRGKAIDLFKDERWKWKKIKDSDDVEKIKGKVLKVTKFTYQTVEVEYGIENYFVEEDWAKQLESLSYSNLILVEVSLNKKGEAFLTNNFH